MKPALPKPAPLNSAQLSGQSQSHLQEVFPGHFLHRDVVTAYRELVEQAAEEGFSLLRSTAGNLECQGAG